MKKKSLNSLSLNKKKISNLSLTRTLGGGAESKVKSECKVCDLTTNPDNGASCLCQTKNDECNKR